MPEKMRRSTRAEKAAKPIQQWQIKSDLDDKNRWKLRSGSIFGIAESIKEALCTIDIFDFWPDLLEITLEPSRRATSRVHNQN